MTISSHKDLLVWQKSMQLVKRIYKLTESFPSHELYGLTSQIRRSAVSIPSNIAEGRRRSTRKDFVSFLYTAFASGAELETQIEIAKELLYLDDSVDELLEEVMKMLNGLIASLKKTTTYNQQPTT